MKPASALAPKINQGENELKLYNAPPSPFGRKARVCLAETGLSGEVELEAAIGTPLDASGMPTDHNPLGKIPCLVLDDGRALYDSRVITRYLNALAGGALYPEGDGLWATLTLEATADGLLDAAVLMVYERRCRPEEIVSDTWLDGQWAKISRALDAIENEWMDHLETKIDMGSIAVGVALGYLDFRHPDRNWRQGRKRLAEWEADFAKRPSMATTVPE